MEVQAQEPLKFTQAGLGKYCPLHMPLNLRTHIWPPEGRQPSSLRFFLAFILLTTVYRLGVLFSGGHVIRKAFLGVRKHRHHNRTVIETEGAPSIDPAIESLRPQYDPFTSSV